MDAIIKYGVYKRKLSWYNNSRPKRRTKFLYYEKEIPVYRQESETPRIFKSVKPITISSLFLQ